MVGLLTATALQRPEAGATRASAMLATQAVKRSTVGDAAATGGLVIVWQAYHSAESRVLHAVALRLGS